MINLDIINQKKEYLKMSTALLIILGKVFAFLVFVVGGYVFMFLNVMRSDPREIIFRKNHDEDSGLMPKKIK